MARAMEQRHETEERRLLRPTRGLCPVSVAWGGALSGISAEVSPRPMRDCARRSQPQHRQRRGDERGASHPGPRLVRESAGARRRRHFKGRPYVCEAARIAPPPETTWEAGGHPDGPTDAEISGGRPTEAAT